MSELQRAVEQIRAWFAKKAPAIVANLNGPVPEADLALARSEGFALGAELSELYGLHDGQRDPEGDYFLPNVAFLPLAAAQAATDRVLEDLFGCPSGHRTSPDEMTGHSFWHAQDEDLFLEEEWTADWFCLGEGGRQFLVQNGRTGRVFIWPEKDDHCVLLGATLGEALGTFAEALRGGECPLQGDPALPEVEQEGFVHVRRYVTWYP